MDLKLNKLSNILGLEILNLDLRKVIDKKLKIKLNDLFIENKVLVIRKQFLNPNEFQKAAEIFGKIFKQHNSKFSLKENPLVHYISNQINSLMEKYIFQAKVFILIIVMIKNHLRPLFCYQKKYPHMEEILNLSI